MALVEIRRIWDQSPYNAFTDLIRYQDRWLCVLREGKAHAGDNGTLRLIASEDGDQWHSVAHLEVEGFDLRDPKLTLTPDGRLMLNSFYKHQQGETLIRQSISYFSDDAETWQGPYEIGDRDFWLWHAEWHKGTAYIIGYYCSLDRFVRLYTSKDGKNFTPLVETLQDETCPNESALVFTEDDTCYCLLRRDNLKGFGNDNALLGIAKPPYTDWQWKDLGERIGGPEMMQLPDGRFITATRKYKFTEENKYDSEWLELCWLDINKGRMKTWHTLPSGNDCSYGGMVFHDGLIWLSYYSAHEEKPCIYLAKIEIE